MSVFPRSWGQWTRNGFSLGVATTLLFFVLARARSAAFLPEIPKAVMAAFFAGMLGALILGCLASFLDGVRGMKQNMPKSSPSPAQRGDSHG